jgi:hypothetical protein
MPTPQDDFIALYLAGKVKVSAEVEAAVTKQLEIDENELKIGIAEEAKEHGLNQEEARKIAMDHLREHPDYYTRMKKCFPR